MSIKCDFVLNKANGVYYIGETVEGTINLQTIGNFKIEDLVISLIGRTTVIFNQDVFHRRPSEGSSERKTTYKSVVNCMQESVNLEANNETKDGKSNYSFQFKLGPECVTSFEGKYGNIRYELKLVINGGNKIFNKPITVLKEIDLNKDPANKKQQRMATHISACSAGSLQARATFTLITPFSGYAPGQAIKYVLHVFKKYNKIENFRVVLVKSVTYVAFEPKFERFNNEEELSECICTDEASISFTKTGELLIPSTSSSIHTDTLIVEYIVRAEATIPCCFDSYLRAEVGIKIGTVPVRESLMANQFVRKRKVQDDKEVANSTDCSNNEIKPPVYKEAKQLDIPFVNTEISAPERIIAFRPMYPVYEIPEK